MNFTPYYNNIEIKPLKKEGPFAEENQFHEMGEVIAIGKNVDFVKVGDTVFFNAHGVFETPEIEGVKHYVVPQDSEYILGKIEHAVAT